MNWIRFLTISRIKWAFYLLSFVGTALLFAFFANNALTVTFAYSKKNYNSQARPILNPHPFKFLISESDLCTRRSPNVFLLIVVHSSVDHVKSRTSIRNTWGSRNLYSELGIATIFLLGKPNPEFKTNWTSMIQRESTHFQDIIQEDYIDSYRNLTYKAISGLRWITEYCQQPAFVLKVDDDVFVNTYRLVYYLRTIHMTDPSINSILCLKWGRMPTITDRNSKWYVSKTEYDSDSYPPYCSGNAFVMPTKAVPLLYNASFYRPFFWVDDVFVTGILAEDANVARTSVPTWYVFSEKMFDRKLVSGDGVFGHHLPFLTMQQRYTYWNKIKLREVYRNKSLTSTGYLRTQSYK